MKIAGQNVLVTGASRGIGLAFAEMVACENAHIHLVLRKDDLELSQKLLKLGAASVKVWIADLSSRESIENLLQQLNSITIDIVFNNAGQLTGGLIEEQPLDEIYSMFQVNVNALVHIARGLVGGMIKRGHGKIINNASVSAFMHFPCASTYAASKAAVVAFTNCLNIELKNTGVSTLCLITPGIKTKMFDEIEVKYSKNFDIPTDSISAEKYALMIREAILKDQNYLWPRGETGVGLFVARYWPSLFIKAATSRFHRN